MTVDSIHLAWWPINRMSTITNTLSSNLTAGHLRPFDVKRDLGQVADLVEQCFADTLDHDGQRYLQQMRSAARNPSYLRWASMVSERAVMPLSGYVWEEAGQIVGNLTLIPHISGGKRVYLIANVAVHPQFRRQGIAVKITHKAIQHASERGAQMVWLHVRAENQVAIDLYRSHGFVEKDRRTTWYLDRQNLATSVPDAGLDQQTMNHAQIRFSHRRAGDWALQRTWIRQAYPKEISWHLSLSLLALQPGLVGFLFRTLNSVWVRHWSAYQGRRLLGVLSWQPSHMYADNLWLAASPEMDEAVVSALLLHARQQLSSRRPLSLDYPAGRVEGAIQQAGFRAHQTLIWMSINLRSDETRKKG